MNFSKVLLAAAILPQIALQAAEIPYYYDYGYPPPVSYVESFGTVVVGAEWLYMKPAVDENYFSEKTVYTPGASGCITRQAPSLNWDSGFRVNLGLQFTLRSVGFECFLPLFLDNGLSFRCLREQFSCYQSGGNSAFGRRNRSCSI